MLSSLSKVKHEYSIQLCVNDIKLSLAGSFTLLALIRDAALAAILPAALGVVALTLRLDHAGQSMGAGLPGGVPLSLQHRQDLILA